MSRASSGKKRNAPVREKIVVFGKGGIGKSLIASNMSVCYALRGLKVLHVGCDPKHDSTRSLLEGGTIQTVMDLQRRSEYGFDTDGFIVQGRHGISCVEAGGPEPGVGCAGRGISRMLELFEKDNLIEGGGYEVVIFDILGDVVCGGFAAPLRMGFGRKVVIVVSRDLMSLYAANNIAKAVNTYAPNGVYLAGLVVNHDEDPRGRSLTRDFAARINTGVLGFLPRDAAAHKAELEGIPLVEHEPKSKLAAELRKLAGGLLSVTPRQARSPTPMSDAEFNEWARKNAAR